jgi:rhodanese-related sulfurtransferase
MQAEMAPQRFRRTQAGQVAGRAAAAASDQALAHFAASFAYETDCADVRSPALYAQGHVPGALNLPCGKLVEAKLRDYPMDTLFVVYCAGPHCNGAQRGAERLARLGRPVKLMIGGVTGWLDEGFAVAPGTAA